MSREGIGKTIFRVFKRRKQPQPPSPAQKGPSSSQLSKEEEEGGQVLSVKVQSIPQMAQPQRLKVFLLFCF